MRKIVVRVSSVTPFAVVLTVPEAASRTHGGQPQGGRTHGGFRLCGADMPAVSRLIARIRREKPRLSLA